MKKIVDISKNLYIEFGKFKSFYSTLKFNSKAFYEACDVLDAFRVLASRLDKLNDILDDEVFYGLRDKDKTKFN